MRSQTKGGVAKITTMNNLGVALATAGKKVLMIDLAPMEMLDRASREKILDRALMPMREDYDFILIESPPQISILTINALSCADTALKNPLSRV